MGNYFPNRTVSKPGGITKTTNRAIVQTINGKQQVVGWELLATYQDFDEVEKKSESRSGTDTPGYTSKLIRAKLLPFNGMSYTRTTEQYPVGWYRTTNTSGLYAGQWSMQIGTYPRDSAWVCNSSGLPPSTRELELMRQECATKVLLKIKDQKANIAQMIAERHKTISMISQRVRQIADAAMHLRRGDILGAVRGLGVGISNRRVRSIRRTLRKPERGLSSSWLELQYGWKPLVGEIYGLAEMLAEADDKIHGKARASVARYFPYEKVTDMDGGSDVDKGGVDARVSYTIYYSASIPGISSMSRLGVTNPALLAWELLPFSFIVDWFFPIGNALSALDATTGLSFRTGGYSVLRRMHRTRSRHTDISTTTSRTESYKDQSFEGVYYTRTRITSFPSVPGPQFKNPVSLMHLANAMALLGVAFGRR